MIYKILVIILTIDAIFRWIKYGPIEVKSIIDRYNDWNRK